MTNLITNMEHYLTLSVEFFTIILEFIGMTVLICTAIRSFILWILHAHKLRLLLAQGIALSLEFKVGSEVLRTVIVRDWEELGILGAVVLLRGVLTFLIYWEIKHEKASLKEEA